MDPNLVQTVSIIIEKYGLGTLNHADVFRGLLRDYYPEVNKLKVTVLVESVRLGIAGLLVQASGRSIEQRGYLEMQRSLHNRPGVGESEAREVVDFWLNYAGKTVLDPISEPIVETSNEHLPLPARRPALASPRLNVPSGSKERTWPKKVLVYCAIILAGGVMVVGGVPHGIVIGLACGTWACFSHSAK